MGFLIDTNVLSELRKKDRADPGVMAWYTKVDGEQLATSVLVIGEIRNGIERLRRRDAMAATALETWLASVRSVLAGRIWPVTSEIADQWGRLGVPDALPVVDGLLHSDTSVAQ